MNYIYNQQIKCRHLKIAGQTIYEDRSLIAQGKDSIML